MQAKIDNTDILSAARKVPCIDVLTEQPPEKSRRCAGPFYPDQSDRLIELLKSLQRRDRFLVAIDGEGLVNLYRRARK